MTRLTAGLALAGGLGLVLATAVTCASILLKLARRTADALFDPAAVGQAAPWLRPILGEEELVSLAVGFALFAALPWVVVRKGHIRVELFAPLFGARLNRALDLVADLVLVGLAWLILTRQWFLVFRPARRREDTLGDLLLQGDMAGALARLNDAEVSQILGLPRWPGYVVAELCIAVFLAAALFSAWRSARALTGRG